MLKLAVNLSMIFTEVPLLQRFALAKAQGFDHVEIQFPYELNIDQISNALAIHQLSLCLINVPAGDLMQGGYGLAGISGRETEFEDALTLAIEYASALNVPRINVLAGRQPLNVAREDCIDTLCNNLIKACQRVSQSNIEKQNKIEVLIEMINGINMPRFLLQSMAHGLQIIEKVQHPALKLQYDCYHMAMMSEDISQCFKDNVSQIGHIQFADWPDRHEPDQAQLNFSEFFQTIQHSGYTGYVAAEYVPKISSMQSFAWKNHYFPD